MSIELAALLSYESINKDTALNQKNLPDGELNPGLPRDRRGYSPLYYRGLHLRRISINKISKL